MGATVGTVSYDELRHFATFLVTATTTGTETASVSLGFVPNRIIGLVETGSTAPETHEYYNGLTAAYDWKTVTAGTKSIVSSNGFTVLGTTGTTPGKITLGTSILQGSSSVATIRICCWR